MAKHQLHEESLTTCRVQRAETQTSVLLIDEVAPLIKMGSAKIVDY